MILLYLFLKTKKLHIERYSIFCEQCVCDIFTNIVTKKISKIVYSIVIQFGPLLYCLPSDLYIILHDSTYFIISKRVTHTLYIIIYGFGSF